MSDNTMSDLQSSIFKFTTDFIAANPGLTFVNFDAHANDSEVPPGDFIGPSGFSFDIDDNFVTISVAFGISTESDTNLFHLSKLMGRLVELLKPAKRIRVVDGDTGENLGWMVVSGKVRVYPVGGTQTKPVQMVGVTLLTNLMYQVEAP